MLRGGSYPRNRNERRQDHLTSFSSKNESVVVCGGRRTGELKLGEAT
jgi:hypothetical protein